MLFCTDINRGKLIFATLFSLLLTFTSYCEMRFAGLRIRPLLVLVVGLVFSLNELAEANCKVLVLEL